jgi:hypothetical protein
VDIRPRDEPLPGKPSDRVIDQRGHDSPLLDYTSLYDVFLMRRKKEARVSDGLPS